MEKAPETDSEYMAFVEALYDEFPSMLRWHNSATGQDEFACFGADPAWLPSIRKMLADLQFLYSINSIELPVFRDFKSKRGYLSIHWDGGCPLADEVIDALEDVINASN